MPRRARLKMKGLPLHIIQRGHNQAPCFLTDADFNLYLGLLQELAPLHPCAVHAYVLMTNHVHLLLTPERPEHASQLIKHLSQRYVQHFNRAYMRSGSLWGGRFRSSIVDSENYLLQCQRYIELNPVRAGMVGHPRDYRWSSYRRNAEAEPSLIVVPHPLYLAMGPTEVERMTCYREFLRDSPPTEEIAMIREAAARSSPVGKAGFVAQVESASRGSVVRRRLGRRRTMERA
jgi:REP-associated tyrosine transposase